MVPSNKDMGWDAVVNTARPDPGYIPQTYNPPTVAHTAGYKLTSTDGFL